MRRPRIRLEPVAFGFGPVGEAVHIATALREEFGGEVDLELVAPGDFQQVATPRLFVQVGEAPSGTRADAVVTVMNSKRAIEIVECGERCYVADSLAWLWDAPSPGGLVADAYLYQELPALPVPERNIQGIRGPSPSALSVGRTRSDRLRTRPALTSSSTWQGCEPRAQTTKRSCGHIWVSSPRTC